MECRVDDFRYKEVINIRDGERLGFVNDMLISIPEGRVLALIVPGPGRFFGLFGREPDYVLPWDCIKRIGNDIVLVEVIGEYHRSKREKHRWFTWQFSEVKTKEE